MRLQVLSLGFLAMSVYAVPLHPTLGEEGKICNWFGTAPLCAGACPPGWTSEKRNAQGPAGSNKCLTGTKAYCCYTTVTQTFGKAPLCSGDCPHGWTREGDSDVGENGQKCITGKAAICTKDIQ
jgi:hypothetical protein